MTAELRADIPLGASSLRWCCDDVLPSFETTDEVEPITGVVGQDDAIEALRYGLEIFAPGQNIYVRGIAGTGRMTLVRQLLEDISPSCPLADDRAYVHNFAQPSRPRLIVLPRGRGRAFRRGVDRLIEFVEEELAQTLNSESMRAKRAALDRTAQNAMRELGAPFEEELRAIGLALVTRSTSGGVQPDILPVVEGEPVPFETLETMRSQGKIEAGEVERIRERIGSFSRTFEEINHKIAERRLRHREDLRALLETETRRFLGYYIEAIESEFGVPEVCDFLADVVADLVQRLGALDQIKKATRKYRVNPILEHRADAGCPIVIENAPTLRNLLGEIEREFVAQGGMHADHMMIQGGSLLNADGGFLILEARDVLAEPGAWKVLIRSLRSGMLEIVPAELASPFGAPFLKPDPIPINVKVVLIGDGGLYEILNGTDPDFGQLFKVLADFESTIPRDRTGVRYYAGVISRIARDEDLLPFRREAVVALVDHGARIAGRRDRLTTRFGRLADIAREAAFLADKENRRSVQRNDVREAIRRGRRRADLPARRFRQMIAEGTIGIRTTGTEIGQVNGLAVVSTGPLTYGFPQRITATVGPGSAGVVDIEREAELSGAIHTKGRTCGSNVLITGRFFSHRVLQPGGTECLRFPGCNRSRENADAQGHPHRGPNRGAQAPQVRLRRPRREAQGLRYPGAALRAQALLRPPPAPRRAGLEDRRRRRIGVPRIEPGASWHGCRRHGAGGDALASPRDAGRDTPRGGPRLVLPENPLRGCRRDRVPAA